MSSARPASLARWYAGYGPLDLFFGASEIHEVAGEVLLVGSEVEVAAPAEVEEDDLFLPGFLSQGRPL